MAFGVDVTQDDTASFSDVLAWSSWLSTASSAQTSVGAGTFGRSLRPATFQSIPDHLLPLALRDANPIELPRRVDGHWSP